MGVSEHLSRIGLGIMVQCFTRAELGFRGGGLGWLGQLHAVLHPGRIRVSEMSYGSVMVR